MKVTKWATFMQRLPMVIQALYVVILHILKNISDN